MIAHGEGHGGAACHRDSIGKRGLMLFMLFQPFAFGGLGRSLFSTAVNDGRNDQRDHSADQKHSKDGNFHGKQKGGYSRVRRGAVGRQAGVRVGGHLRACRSDIIT